MGLSSWWKCLMACGIESGYWRTWSWCAVCSGFWWRSTSNKRTPEADAHTNTWCLRNWPTLPLIRAFDLFCLFLAFSWRLFPSSLACVLFSFMLSFSSFPPRRPRSRFLSPLHFDNCLSQTCCCLSQVFLLVITSNLLHYPPNYNHGGT